MSILCKRCNLLLLLFALCLQQPSSATLQVLGRTVEKLSERKFTANMLIGAVCVGVAVGMCAGACDNTCQVVVIQKLLMHGWILWQG